MLDVALLQSYGLTVAADSDGSVGNTYREGSTHHAIGSNQYRGHRIEAGAYGETTRKLTITSGTDTVYLPFWQNNISSVELPTSGPLYFVTDNMSGCCLFLGEKADGTLVAFHANSELKSKEADLKGKAANFQHIDTVRKLDTLVRTARPEVGVTKIVGGCSKAQYNQGVAKNSQSWLGGTTIVGFRNGTNWSFWYQTWGSLGGGGLAVHEAKQFWP